MTEVIVPSIVDNFLFNSSMTLVLFKVIFNGPKGVGHSAVKSIALIVSSIADFNLYWYLEIIDLRKPLLSVAVVWNNLLITYYLFVWYFSIKNVIY